MFKKNWFGSWTLKPNSKQIHSLDNLKTLYNVLFKNQVVSEQNKHLLVETLRSIAEILIWGDQNDSTVFDFFLEKNMLSFFLKIMSDQQKCGSYVCVQLLQTLNILFENIRDETSLYYLLSNNHVNSIIVHKFDFSDEEVMAYYISFLKTLSFKLNDHTIHFFFNEHTNDFPLYTEAIKFFNHNEKMVRIAVRTLTLNVFKVEEKSMLKFVGDHTAVPYFSNLVWFIGNHVLEIDNCLRKPIKDQQTLIKLDDLVAEHLDHLHYLNDILLLRIDDLNKILTEHLLNRLLVPLYIYSLIASSDSLSSNDQRPAQSNEYLLTRSDSLKERPLISRIVSLFLLSQIFLIISYDSLVQQLVEIILNGNFNIFEKPQFIAPPETLEESLVNNLLNKSSSSKIVYEEDCRTSGDEERDTESMKLDVDQQTANQFSKDEMNSNLSESDQHIFCESDQIKDLLIEQFLKDKPFLEALYNSFDCTNQQDDQLAVFSLSLLYAIIFNSGIQRCQLEGILLNENRSVQTITYQIGSSKLIDHIAQIIRMSGKFDSFIRPITLELCALLLIKLCIKEEGSVLSDHHLAIIEQTKENSTSVVRNYFRNENENLFLDLFEDEYMEFSKFKINVEYLLMDANLLIPPRQLEPLMLNNLHFIRRLPYSDIEKARYALRVFFIIRNLSMMIINESDNELPLTNVKKLICVNDSIDLKNCNLVHCFLQLKNQSKEEGYIVILDEQLVFIEPDNQRIGLVSAKYTANLQNIDVCLDKDDSRSLLLTIRPNAANGSQPKFGAPDLSSFKTGSSKHSNTNVKLIFDDYIRCRVTEQHISRGKQNVIQRKLRKIASLIDIQLDAISNQSSNGILSTNQQQSKNRNHHLSKSQSSGNGRNLKSSNHLQSGLAIPGGAMMFEKNKHQKSPSNNSNSAASASLSTNLVQMSSGKLPNVFAKRTANRKSVSSVSSSSSHRNSNKNSRNNSRDNSPKPQEQIIQEIPMSELNSPICQRKKMGDSISLGVLRSESNEANESSPITENVFNQSEESRLDDAMDE